MEISVNLLMKVLFFYGVEVNMILIEDIYETIELEILTLISQVLELKDQET
jgi:hypothetical protein